jgi:trigger factor
MAHTVTRKPDHTVEIDASIAADAIAAERETIVRKFRRHAQIPGFRVGKAPSAAVAARFAEEIESDLREHLVEQIWTEFVEEQKDLVPLAQPRITEAEFGEDGGFVLKAVLEVRPEYDLPDLDGVELPEVSTDVPEPEVDEELDKIRDEQAAWEPVEDGAVEDGLLVEADLHGVMDDSDEPPYEEKDARFVVGEGAVPPEINEALQGAKVGDERVAERRFPDDDENTDRAGKAVRYTIQVKGIKRKSLPDADDALAQGMGFETLEELRERISMVLRNKKLGDRRDAWRRAALDHLEQDLSHDELPPGLVGEALHEDMNRLAYTLAMQGQADQEIDWNQIRVKMEPESRRRVLDTLVLEQLAREWELQVPEAEVEAYIAGEAQQQGIPAAEHRATLEKENRIDAIRHAALMATTVSEMIARAGGQEDE